MLFFKILKFMYYNMGVIYGEKYEKILLFINCYIVSDKSK